MTYNYVILAIGGKVDTNIYGLSEVENFISNPYPLMQNLDNINLNKKIGIVGSSLTAIDCFLLLKQKGCKNITMISRRGILPSVRGKDSKYNLNFFTKEKIKCLENININKLLGLFLEEFIINNIDWKKLFLENKETTDYESFKYNIITVLYS